jgi:transcriptional regulator GlxA family with amidase domain
MNIGIYIYEKAEVLDFSGPFEVFTTASRVCRDQDPFRVFLIGENGDLVTARAGYRVQPDCGFSNHPRLDLLMVVGGYHYDELEKADVLAWIARQAGQADYVASVCSGTWLLAAAGVLSDQEVTTHWEDISALQKAYPDLTVVPKARWVDAGRIITSAGISAGIDMSLHLVSRFHSPELAEKTARQMEYDWVKKR